MVVCGVQEGGEKGGSGVRSVVSGENADADRGAEVDDGRSQLSAAVAGSIRVTNLPAVIGRNDRAGSRGHFLHVKMKMLRRQQWHRSNIHRSAVFAEHGVQAVVTESGSHERDSLSQRSQTSLFPAASNDSEFAHRQ